MITANLNQLELNEFVAPYNPGQRCKATFPMLGTHGTKSSAVVYVELNPQEELGTHTDSAEEILLILEGTVEATVGEERQTASKGQLVLVPEMVPHNVKNAGDVPVKFIGFFGGANNIVATFDQVWLPTGSNRVDTSAMP